MHTHHRKIFLVSLFVTLLIMAIVYCSFQIGREPTERYFPLVSAVKEIKSEMSEAHSLLDDILSSNRTADIDDIWGYFDQSKLYAQTILKGGTYKGSVFKALNDHGLRTSIEETIESLQYFREITHKRLNSLPSHSSNSDVKQNFDIAFVGFNISIDHVENTLQEVTIEDIQAVKLKQYLLIILIFILGMAIGGVLLYDNIWKVQRIAALKLSRGKLRQSQKQLEGAINGAKLGYWDWNYKTGEFAVNDEWLMILGLSREGFTNHIREWEKLVHPSDKDLLLKTVQLHIQSEKELVVEFRMMHADGRCIWIQSSGSIIEYQENTREPFRLCGTHQDVTERKTTELREKSRTQILEMLASNELLPVILEAIVRSVEQENPAMLCSILLLDDTGKQLFNGIGPSLPDFYNAEIEGLSIGVGFGSCGTAAFTNKRVIVENIQTHPYWAAYRELASKAGLGSCWSEPIRSSQGQVLGTFAIYHRNRHQPTLTDINLIEHAAYLASIAIEQAKVFLSLKNNEQRLHQVLQSIPSFAVQGYDYEGKTFFWNKASEKLYGYSVEEALGQSIYDLIIPPSMHIGVRDEMQKMFESKHAIPSAELSLMTKGGGSVDVFSSHAYVHVPGLPPEMFCIDVDLTERKQAEKKLKLAANVFSYAREGIIITDTEGVIIDVNNAFTITTGYNRDEVVGQNSRILQSGRQSREFYADMWKGLLDQGYWSGEVWNRRKNGEVYAELKAINVVRDEQNLPSHYVAFGSDITLIKEHQDQLEHIAHYDILTNLPNRSLLADRLSQAMLQCDRYGQSLAVVFLDLDGFKQVNDTHGHSMGDELLIALSAHMKGALRENDSLARIGGDEFVAVLANLAKVEDCEPVLERLLLSVSEPVTIDGIVLNISASIGVTLYPQDNVDADLLMRHADQAMYVAKESGKNRYHLFDTIQDSAVKARRESLEAIREALDNDQFVLYYQPKVNMKTGRVIGVEALIRWQHPKRGLLNPGDFLPVIENNPIIIEMGEWVINTALTQIGQWQGAEFNYPISISVNIAALQLQHSKFVTRLTALLAAHPNVEPHYLELEILETSALGDIHHVSKIMKDCLELGVNFALDDFGTGYSSLTYLRRFPAKLVKIDQSFVRDMLHDADDLAIVEGVVALAKSFKREVIAEGVETIEQGTALLQLGCDLAQGYGIAKPMPASDIPVWISNWKPDSHWKN